MKVLSFKKLIYIWSAFIVLIILLRLAAPSLILWQVNSQLDKFSPTYTAHAEDLDLSFLRMNFIFKDIQAKLKSSSHSFASAQKVEISLSWRDLLKMQIATDVIIDQLKVDLDKKLFALMKENTSGNFQFHFPVTLKKLQLHQSEIEISKFENFKIDKTLRVVDVEAEILNLISMSPEQDAKIQLTAHLPGGAPLRAHAMINLKANPLDWNLNFHISNFHLNLINGFLIDTGGVTVKNGILEAYSEMQQAKGHMKGSIKVYVKNLKMMGDSRDFEKGGSQFFREILIAIGAWILKNRDSNFIATQVDFKMNRHGQFKIDEAKILRTALENSSLEGKAK